MVTRARHNARRRQCRPIGQDPIGSCRLGQWAFPRSWARVRAPPASYRLHEDRRLQTVILLAGLAGIAFAVSRTVDTLPGSRDAVGPGMGGRCGPRAGGDHRLRAAWKSPFGELIDEPASGRRSGTFYLAQLRYLPVGGFAKRPASWAPLVGVPLRQAAVAFGLCRLCGRGVGNRRSRLAHRPSPGSVRISVCGLATPILTYVAALMAGARPRPARHPPDPRLGQSGCRRDDIVVFYGWALVTIGSSPRTVLLGSLHRGRTRSRILRIRTQLGDRLHRHTDPGRCRCPRAVPHRPPPGCLLSCCWASLAMRGVPAIGTQAAGVRQQGGDGARRIRGARSTRTSRPP